MTSKGPAWTRDEDAALMLAVNARVPYREIAQQMARTFPAVAMRVCRLRHGRPVDKQRRYWSTSDRWWCRGKLRTASTERAIERVDT